MDKIEVLIPCYNEAQTIYVGAPDKSSGKRAQHIHIKYDSVGFIPPGQTDEERRGRDIPRPRQIQNINFRSS